MFADYEFQSQFFSLDGLQLHYLDEGSPEGEPVVMVHGNPTWSYYYRHLIAALRDRYRVIAPDHIGMGLSEKPGDARYPYSLERRSEDLERLLSSLGVESNITLVVHDWGGAIGLAYATRYPDRIRRLVVLNTAAFHLPANKRFPWLLHLCRIPILGSLLVRGLNGFCEFAALRCVTSPMVPEVRRAYLAPYNSWANRLAILRFVQDIPIHPGHQSYDTITRIQSKLDSLQKTPTLFCWGLRDFIFDEDYLEEFLNYFPSAEAHRFPYAGHYVLEDAGTEIIGLVERFLAR